jgi:hypothetical protein
MVGSTYIYDSFLDDYKNNNLENIKNNIKNRDFRLYDAYIYSIKNSNFDIIKYFIELEPELKKNKILESIFSELCTEGNFKVAKFLHEQNSDLDLATKNNIALYCGIEAKDFDFLQWLLNENKNINKQHIIQCFTNACHKKQFDIADFFYKEKTNILQLRFIQDILKDMCDNEVKLSLDDRIEVINWILLKVPKKTIRHDNDIMFTTACKGVCGLELVQYLLELEPTINILAENCKGFKNACEKGQFEIAKFLYEKNNKINISASNEFAFCSACSNGYFEIAQWLLIIKPDINLSVDNEYPFRMSYYNGYTEIAKWLLSIKPDINIRAKNDWLFTAECKKAYLKGRTNYANENDKPKEKNNFNKVLWLTTLVPEYNIEIDDDRDIIMGYGVKSDDCGGYYKKEIDKSEYNDVKNIGGI